MQNNFLQHTRWTKTCAESHSCLRPLRFRTLRPLSVCARALFNSPQLPPFPDARIERTAAAEFKETYTICLNNTTIGEKNTYIVSRSLRGCRWGLVIDSSAWWCSFSRDWEVSKHLRSWAGSLYWSNWVAVRKVDWTCGGKRAGWPPVPNWFFCTPEQPANTEGR